MVDHSGCLILWCACVSQVITASVKSFADCFSSPHGHHTRKPIPQGNTNSPGPISFSLAKSGKTWIQAGCVPICSKESDTLTYNTVKSSTNIDTNNINGRLCNDKILFLGKILIFCFSFFVKLHYSQFCQSGFWCFIHKAMQLETSPK